MCGKYYFDYYKICRVSIGFVFMNKGEEEEGEGECNNCTNVTIYQLVISDIIYVNKCYFQFIFHIYLLFWTECVNSTSGKERCASSQTEAISNYFEWKSIENRSQIECGKYTNAHAHTHIYVCAYSLTSISANERTLMTRCEYEKKKSVIFTRMVCVWVCVCTSGRKRPNSNKKTFERIQNLLFDLEAVFGIVSSCSRCLLTG